LPESEPTSDRQRIDIDSGKAGDKIAFPDPAAAPLGTDDEAAGTPPSRTELRIEQASLTEPVPVRRRVPIPVRFYIGAIVVLVLAILIIRRWH
jgi:hypothetical protein